MSATRPPSILFVCLGNICRSPLAEGIFLHLAERHGLDGVVVDSAGTGDWHAGEGPDRRAMAVARRRGVHLPSIARQVRVPEDFDRFTHLVPMDASNMAHLLDLGAPPGRVRLMRAYDPAHAGLPVAPDVPDPYYGGDDGFDRVFDMLESACLGLVEHLRTGS
ncbi:MAG: low molecular weight phosphotyrosine protein phosphatase [Phycisphaeraceae bacterium]|nr:low molecular weight phosphotyrosine protein phosphatase [Phycisphaeraceae bacterium]